MPASQFYEIVNSENVSVSIPKTSHFSIGTSPYYAHQYGLAIDIYHEISLENYEVLSPISGRVIKKKTLIAPNPRFSGGINKEYLTLIQNKDNPKTVFKLLHVDPIVKKGQYIEVGDVLGTTIRNGYFATWSSPHLHLEIRSKEDSIRASGGKPFYLYFKDINQREKNLKENYNDKIPITIDAIFQNYFLAHLPEDLYYKIDPYIGVKGKNLNSDCIIDGGIPIYKRGIAIFNTEFKSEYLASTFLNGQKIGALWNQRRNFGFIKFDQVKFYLNDKEIRGISLFLANFKPFIKIIPYDIKDYVCDVNSIHYLSLVSVP